MSQLIKRAAFDATPRCLRSVNTIKQPPFWQRHKEELQIVALYAFVAIAFLIAI